MADTNHPVRVLHATIGGPEYTGVASFLYQYYQHVNHDRVHFDFLFGRQNSMKLVCADPIFADSEFIELGAVKRKNAVSYHKLYRGVKKITASGKYDVLHINTVRPVITLICALAAKKSGMPVIIAHSHNGQHAESLEKAKSGLRDKVKSAIGDYIRKHCDFLFGCSVEAGAALFGQKGVEQDNFAVLKNAIDAKKFSFSTQIRADARQKAGAAEDCFVLGQVGRLCATKNQMFSLQVFSEILKANPNSALWLIGIGPDQKKLEDEANRLGIAEKVRFLGERTDVPELMQGMDALLFPSFCEGLGIVAIEAQSTGLPTYASDAIPKETAITDLIRYFPLQDGAESWAEQILKLRGNAGTRTDQRAAVEKSGYDIYKAAKWLEDFYVDIVSRKAKQK